MNCVLRTKSGQWYEGMVSGSEIPEESAMRWATSACAVLGLPSDSLEPVYFSDGEADPRDGNIITEPVVEVAVSVSPPAIAPLTGDEIVKLRALIGEK